jgi:hypothetical protein
VAGSSFRKFLPEASCPVEFAEVVRDIPIHLPGVVLCLIEEMPTAVLNGAFLKDAKGKDFLVVVDIHREIRNVQDAAMFHLKVGSTFEFPVVLAWVEHGQWRMAGPEPWKRIVEEMDLFNIRLYQIPVSDPDTEKRLRNRKKSARGGS